MRPVPEDVSVLDLAMHLRRLPAEIRAMPYDDYTGLRAYMAGWHKGASDRSAQAG